MINDIRANRRKLKELFDSVIVKGKDGAPISLDEALQNLIETVMRRSASGGRLLFIGNGGSASIASHLSTDFLKNAGIPAMAFSDSALLTCVSNDLGYEYVFEKPVRMFASSSDVLFAISSSGRSENILRAAHAAREKGLSLITLSGFTQDNPLRKLGDMNFYVPSESYGHVEIVHLALCHCLVDIAVEKKNG